VSYLFFIEIAFRRPSRSTGEPVMRGTQYGWLLVVLGSGCIPAGADLTGSPGSQIAISEDMIPDPRYRPQIGDHAILYAVEDGQMLERLPLLKDLTAYDIYVRSQQARDGERLAELEEQGWLQWAPPGSRVTVLAMQDRNHTGAHTASQIRVADERLKTQTFWTPSDSITKLIHKAPE
jgi:hypothetical protein